MVSDVKKTKIVATIGPASESVSTLEKMIKAGLNVTRINFSHGDHQSAGAQIKNVRTAAAKTGKTISILQDLSGPKIRTGDFEGGETKLKRGSVVEITVKKILGSALKFSVNYPKLLKDVEVGQRILINDGKQSVKVISIGKESLKAKVIYGGTVRSRRGVNLPDSHLTISSITVKDKKDLAYGVSQDVDFVAMSFVRSADDVVALKKLLSKHKSKARVIAKIETPRAVASFDEILAVTDGVMVARGDMAVEIGTQKVPAVQEMIIRKCTKVGKPAIVATQMLESMIHAPVPTRAEVTDVSHAVYTGADAVMLSEESAMGEYPVETVSMMSSIAVEAEQMIDHKNFNARGDREEDSQPKRIDDVISRYAVKTAYDIDAKVIIALTESGQTARLVSRYKPSQKILVISSQAKTLQQTNLSYGAFPLATDHNFKNISDVVTFAKEIVKKHTIAKKGDRVVVAVGVPFGKSGGTNTVHAIEI